MKILLGDCIARINYAILYRKGKALDYQVRFPVVRSISSASKNRGLELFLERLTIGSAVGVSSSCHSSCPTLCKDRT